MENVQKIVKIPRFIHWVDLFGPKDRYLNMARKHFQDTRVKVGSEDIFIFGPKEEVERCSRFFEKILDALGSGEKIVEQDVDLLLRQMDSGVDIDTCSNDVILKIGKNAVKAKTPHQKEYVEAIQNNTITFAIGVAGSAKALSHGTMIPMFEGGFKDIADIQVGDTVIGQDGKPTKVTGVFPQGLREEYRVDFSDGRFSLCSKDHLWPVYTNSHGRMRKQVLTTEQLVQIGVKNSIGNADKKPGNRFNIPCNQCIQFPEQEYDIHPYVMGAFLGDGCCKEKPLTLSSNDTEIVERIADLIGAAGYKRNSEKNFSWTFPLQPQDYYRVYSELQNRKNIHRRFETLRFFEKYKNEVCVGALDKRIPEDYFYGSEEQRLELLRGLLDTDGTIGGKNKGRVGFSSTSYQLCKDVMRLSRSLGLVTSWRKTMYTKRKNPLYSIGIACAPEKKKELFFVPRKVQRAIEYEKYVKQSTHRRGYNYIKIIDIQPTGRTVPMTCIMVDNEDRLFLTQDYVVTHNTYLAVTTAIKALRDKEVDKIIITRPPVALDGLELGFIPGSDKDKMSPWVAPLVDVLGKFYTLEQIEDMMEKGTIESVPLAYIRGRSFERCFVIVDEAQNASINVFKSVLTRLGVGSKIVICGDTQQTDIDSSSGLETAARIMEGADGVSIIRMGFEDIVRSGITAEVIKRFTEAGF